MARTAGRGPAEAERVLRGLGIFAEASDVSFGILVRGAEERDLAAGIDVIKEGRIPTRFYVVLSGVLDIYSTGESGTQARKINSLQEGDYFGEIGIVEGMPSTATVRTAIPCRLLSVRAPDFLEALAESPALTHTFLDRIRGDLARSHPTYRIAVAGAGDGRGPVATDLSRAVEELTPVLRAASSDELLRTVTATALNLFDAAACSLALVTEGGDELIFASASGQGADGLIGRRLPIGTGIAGAVVRTAEPIVIPDLARDERFAGSFADETGYRPSTIIARPLQSEGRVIGVIEVLDPGAFDNEKGLTVLALFARLAALAISQKRILERVRGLLGA